MTEKYLVAKGLHKNRQYLLIGKACANSNDADQMVDGVVEADSFFKEATY